MGFHRANAARASESVASVAVEAAEPRETRAGSGGGEADQCGVCRAIADPLQLTLGAWRQCHALLPTQQELPRWPFWPTSGHRPYVELNKRPTNCRIASADFQQSAVRSLWPISRRPASADFCAMLRRAQRAMRSAIQAFSDSMSLVNPPQRIRLTPKT